MDKLAEKTALITGGALRLGRAMALALAARGANVAVHYNRSERQADELVDELTAMGVRASALAADLSDETAVKTLLARAVETVGPLDILVNSASIYEGGRVLDLTAEDLSRHVQINALAPLELARAFAAQKRPGHIINFLDATVLDQDASHAAYHLSKRMLLQLTQLLAVELAPAVAVNAIAPGLIIPPPGEPADAYDKLTWTNPMHKVGSVEAIVHAAMFLLESDFITGQVIFVDGGRHLKRLMPRHGRPPADHGQ
ncbi:MAG: SDR family oxidoreductase [Planctomycetaceae bacterium]|nr:SDR family oxidoreductase [Planctomycetaceae bacterium]